MYASVQPDSSNKTPREPAFLRERVDAFYEQRVKNSWNGGHICRGRVPEAGDIVMISNDYLSLANHSHILRTQADAMLDSGIGLLMSGIFLNGANPQAALEKRFADFLQADGVVLCQSGWCANTGLIQSIANERVPVYIDLNAHMSLWEGIRSAGAPARPFRHNDADHLENLVRRYGSGVIVVDSIYSTSGSICPLEEIAGIGERHDCVVVVDESHSLGTHGARGEGLVASLGLSGKVHFRTASLAKAFAARAGLITCGKDFPDYFRTTSSPAIFSSTLLPHEVHGLGATLDVIQEESWRRTKLHHNADVLRNGLLDLGYNVTDSQSQILGLEAGPEPQTLILRDALEKRGVFGAVFAAPATSTNRSLVRLSVNASLTEKQLTHILNACRDMRDEVKLAEWPSTRRMQRRKARVA